MEFAVIGAVILISIVADELVKRAVLRRPEIADLVFRSLISERPPSGKGK